MERLIIYSGFGTQKRVLKSTSLTESGGVYMPSLNELVRIDSSLREVVSIINDYDNSQIEIYTRPAS